MNAVFLLCTYEVLGRNKQKQFSPFYGNKQKIMYHCQNVSNFKVQNEINGNLKENSSKKTDLFHKLEPFKSF